VFYTFTGQEDDDDLGLYNYHARLYDPVLGRFISPDRLVPSPGNLQAFNRYTYCLNNPLIYTDPNGEWIFELIVGIIAAVVGSTRGAYQAKRSGQNVYAGAFLGGIRALVSCNTFGAIFEGSMSGAIQARQSGKNPWAGAMLGGTVAAVSSAVSSGMGGFVGASAGGGFSSLVNAYAYGGNPWKEALYGGLYSVAYAGTVQGAIALGQSISGDQALGTGGGSPEEQAELSKLIEEQSAKYPEAIASELPGAPSVDWGQFSANWTEFGKGVYSGALAGADTFNRWSLDVVLTVNHAGWGTADALLNAKSGIPPGQIPYGVIDAATKTPTAGRWFQFGVTSLTFFKGYIHNMHMEYHKPGYPWLR